MTKNGGRGRDGQTKKMYIELPYNREFIGNLMATNVNTIASFFKCVHIMRENANFSGANKY